MHCSRAPARPHPDAVNQGSQSSFAQCTALLQLDPAPLKLKIALGSESSAVRSPEAQAGEAVRRGPFAEWCGPFRLFYAQPAAAALAILSVARLLLPCYLSTEACGPSRHPNNGRLRSTSPERVEPVLVIPVFVCGRMLTAGTSCRRFGDPQQENTGILGPLAIQQNRS
jgi:hypothetical protein